VACQAPREQHKVSRRVKPGQEDGAVHGYAATPADRHDEKSVEQGVEENLRRTEYRVDPGAEPFPRTAFGPRGLVRRSLGISMHDRNILRCRTKSSLPPDGRGLHILTVFAILVRISERCRSG